MPTLTSMTMSLKKTSLPAGWEARMMLTDSQRQLKYINVLMGTRPTGNNMRHRAVPWGKVPLMMCFRCRSGCSRLTGQAQFGIRLFGELRHPRTLLVLPCVVANFCWAQKIRFIWCCSLLGRVAVCGQ